MKYKMGHVTVTITIRRVVLLPSRSQLVADPATVLGRFQVVAEALERALRDSVWVVLQ